MNTYNIELILQPDNGQGRRYISIKTTAENEEEAKQFATEMIKSVVKDNVDVFCKERTV